MALTDAQKATVLKAEQLNYFKTKQDTANQTKFDGKVDKADGKSLIADTEITRLGGIETGAQVNVIESVSVKNEDIVTVTNKGVQIDLSAYAKSADYTTALTYKGTVDTYSALPTEGMKTGDVYNVTAADAEHGINAGDNVAYNGTGWDNLAGVVDLSGKVDKADGKSLIADTEITRLASIETGAQVNVIESVSVKNEDIVAVTDKGVEIDLSAYAKTADVTYATNDVIDAMF